MNNQKISSLLEYQTEYSELHPDTMYDTEIRQMKANKILSVLKDYFAGPLIEKNLLDIGCSTGIMTSLLAQEFKHTIGTDIDEPGVSYAQTHYPADNLKFEIQDALNLTFQDNCFDVVVCAHIYEHVPDAQKMMKEIFRVLKPGGVCYFAAGNRLNLIEPHYRLPFLSILPRWLGHKYLRLTNKGTYYYETHKTLWGLRKLSRNFQRIDYDLKIIREPEKFSATEMVKSGTFTQKIAIFVVKYFYFLFPTYIWLLKKPHDTARPGVSTKL